MRRYILLALLFIGGYDLQAQMGPVPQSEVKAVFLYNFTGFVEWPGASFTDANAPLVIGVWGDNPFGNYLNDVIANEKKTTHPLQVKYFTRVEDIKNCHILFINKQKPEQISQAITLLKGTSVLTVGDSPDFVKSGGMIRFLNQDNKVRLQINMSAVKNSELAISSKLLRLAELLNNNE